MGLAIGWRSAQAGLSVTIVDDAPGKGASRAAAGMLAPVTEVHYGEEALLQLALASSEHYPDFVADLEQDSGRDAGYSRCGTLAVARDTDENAALEELYRFQHRLGLDVERLRSKECRDLEPALAPTIRGGVFVEGDHQIDNRMLLDALEEACRRSGVTFLLTRAREIVVRGDKVVGVRTADDEAISADQVVLAAGCWSGSIAGVPAEALPPVRPVKGQLIHLRSADKLPLATRTIRGLDAYIVNRPDGRAVIGATVEERGFDTTVTAGAVHELLRDAYELLPGIAEMEVTEVTAGLRPGSPDNAPLLGPSTIERLSIATGHYRNGILLAPVTAASIARLLATGEVDDIIRPFSPQRFAASESVAT